MSCGATLYVLEFFSTKFNINILAETLVPNICLLTAEMALTAGADSAGAMPAPNSHQSFNNM